MRDWWQYRRSDLAFLEKSRPFLNVQDERRGSLSSFGVSIWWGFILTFQWMISVDVFVQEVLPIQLKLPGILELVALTIFAACLANREHNFIKEWTTHWWLVWLGLEMFSSNLSVLTEKNRRYFNTSQSFFTEQKVDMNQSSACYKTYTHQSFLHIWLAKIR